jgi:hypothetical protein
MYFYLMYKKIILDVLKISTENLLNAKVVVLIHQLKNVLKNPKN